MITWGRFSNLWTVCSRRHDIDSCREILVSFSLWLPQIGGETSSERSAGKSFDRSTSSGQWARILCCTTWSRGGQHLERASVYYNCVQTEKFFSHIACGISEAFRIWWRWCSDQVCTWDHYSGFQVSARCNCRCRLQGYSWLLDRWEYLEQICVHNVLIPYNQPISKNFCFVVSRGILRELWRWVCEWD